MPQPQWQLQPIHEISIEFLQAVRQQIGDLPGHYIAQLLWQRGKRNPAEVAGFLNPGAYCPTSPFEFGAEMHLAIERLQQARQNEEKVAIWGDFDADGITATAVLWEGLSQFFPIDRLTYFIPNRLTDSHGLSCAGITRLLEQGYSLIVTCDTGSTNRAEVEFAQTVGMDVIITDHHALPPDRPPVSAILNPRFLPIDHPLATLSGVAVAYKLIEALYLSLPDVPQRPLEALLDLVAIGLIADLVNLTGDCRYLAQRGIEKLQQNQPVASRSPAFSPTHPPRPGITRLLELCKRNGDRPTDISFGLGPRINAISRIQGDAHFCVELLTSRDVDRCRQLAEDTDLANTRRKALQRDVVQQVRARLAQLDLSTTRIIVLADSQWSVGILGLVAGQIAQEYGRPTILLSYEEGVEEDKNESQYFSDSSTLTFGDSPAFGTPLVKRDRGDQVLTKRSWNESLQSQVLSGMSVRAINPKSRSQPVLARGSARSLHEIDLYQLVKNQAHLLHRYGGHPQAMGLSLPLENVALFAEAINRCLREQQEDLEVGAIVRADLTVTVVELGKALFRELKLIEPCGMGNPVPRLLIRNCWFARAKNANIQDWRGRKVRYIKTECELYDDSMDIGFPAVWWDHYRDELPAGRCEAIVELDFNPYYPRYEVRLIAVRSLQDSKQSQLISIRSPVDWILDWRTQPPTEDREATPETTLTVTRCPASWDELHAWFRRAIPAQKLLALAYLPPSDVPPIEIWQRLVGMAKYLSRTGKAATRQQLLDKLDVGDRSLQRGFNALKSLGFQITATEAGFYMRWNESPQPLTEAALRQTIAPFLTIVQEEQFHRHYFYQVPLATIQAVASQTLCQFRF